MPLNLQCKHIIKAARKVQKITQRELAEKLLIAVRYLADIEFLLVLLPQTGQKIYLDVS